jgi:hypothetical protein
LKQKRCNSYIDTLQSSAQEAHHENFWVTGISELLVLQPLVAGINSLMVVVGVPADLLQVLVVKPGCKCRISPDEPLEVTTV